MLAHALEKSESSVCGHSELSVHAQLWTTQPSTLERLICVLLGWLTNGCLSVAL